MTRPFILLASALALTSALPRPALAQTLVATGGVTPNREGELARPVRYTPDGDAFRIENGTERYNRPLYGGNTAFRVDGGDRPEFVLYLPGRGGNLRFAVRLADGTHWWLHDAAAITTHYRPGELTYRITDPRLGTGAIELVAVALAETEGLAIHARGQGLAGGVQLAWAFGGINGQRGTRDGDIGTEKVPISEWFGFQPAFAQDNSVGLLESGFTLTGKPGTITGTLLQGSVTGTAPGEAWDTPAALFAGTADEPDRPVMTGSLQLGGEGGYLVLQRTAYAPAANADLTTYAEVSADRRAPAPLPPLARRYAANALPQVLADARAHFAALRGQVRIVTPDSWLNAAAAALNVAADAVWDGPQSAIMHGAVAWRTKLVGWRGPYSLDALGWHDRARANFRAWLPRQNTDPIPDVIPPADSDSNLARNETALHSNGDLANAHYDMNAVFVDALFRHIAWTGDLDFAREAWPAIQRHLAWERRLFRRPFGPDGLPLYEAYAQIWASDDIGYNGGGVAYASAYNLFHNRQAARLARALGEDAAPYEAEAEAIGQGMRAHLWLPERGQFAEYRDWLGEQAAHPAAGLWSFYHVLDSGVPDRQEAWRMAEAIGRTMPLLPVGGPGVPQDRRHGLYASSTWMPYTWSVNNVVMGENLHTALGLWQAGRAEEAYTLARSALLASMFMGISPGNVGSMNYLDVYRREAQRDFADGSGVMARTMVEGLFGLQPDALARNLTIQPGLPAEWDHAELHHPDLSFTFRRTGAEERWSITQTGDRFAQLHLRLPARSDQVASVTLAGKPVQWRVDTEAVGTPAILIDALLGAEAELVVRWAGDPIAQPNGTGTRFAEWQQGAMRWWAPVGPAMQEATFPTLVDAAPTGSQRAVELAQSYNDAVTNIFAPGKYVSPRSPFASLALPSQGLGAWAGHVNASATIDDSGLRQASRAGDGWFTLPDGGRFALPADRDNALFVSKWDNYPDEVTLPLSGSGQFLRLLMAGTTNAMQSRIDNGEVVVTYTDCTTTRLALHNPTTWWPIERDYLPDDYQFRVPGPRPLRVDLATARVRQGGEAGAGTGPEARIEGGSATVLGLELDPARTLQSLTVRARANEVVIGLLAATIDSGP
ncbi:DUF4450 domain-containing protein [Croceibacterium ferulae]|uniref:DUF4450 domain-containing protein n=1 Tax=Croceibacterium ferulae TaxID=1854641 RepID=UPI000EAEE931|nr:DUF4450 domain-containing protein [Croceibacterium ferulae]